MILVHNHLSSSPKPSRADEALPVTRRNALDLVKVRVIDHLIVAGASICSMAERGLI